MRALRIGGGKDLPTRLLARVRLSLTSKFSANPLTRFFHRSLVHIPVNKR